MKRIVLTAVVALFLAMPGAAEAQEEVPQPVKIEDADWYEIVHVSFKPGAFPEARKLIEEHLWAAGQRAGVPGPILMFHRTGPWDMTLVWELEGPADLEWLMDEEGAKHAAALAEMSGGIEQAEQIWQRYFDMVDRTESYLAFRPQQFDRSESGGN